MAALNSMVHFTGIWKALGHNKADVVRLIESQPESEFLCILLDGFI